MKKCQKTFKLEVSVNFVFVKENATSIKQGSFDNDNIVIEQFTFQHESNSF